MKKQIAAAVLSGMLVLGSVVPALAQGTTGTVGINGGTLSITPAPFSMQSVTLDGINIKTAESTTEDPWVANDPTGTGAGWTATVIAGDFISGTHKISASGFTMEGVTIVKAAGSDQLPTSLVTGSTPINVATPFASAAAGDGMGSYNLTPSFKLSVPVDTYAAMYTAIVTVTIAASPQ